VVKVRRNTAIALAAVAGAVAGAVVARLRRQPGTALDAPDTRAEALRQKLAEARLTSAEEEDFEVAGMGAETVVEEAPRPAPPTTPPPAEEPRPPGEEFEAMRQRIHEEGRAAAEEMRRAGDPDAE
jgi:hypothetical protein